MTKMLRSSSSVSMLEGEAGVSSWGWTEVGTSASVGSASSTERFVSFRYIVSACHLRVISALVVFAVDFCLTSVNRLNLIRGRVFVFQFTCFVFLFLFFLIICSCVFYVVFVFVCFCSSVCSSFSYICVFVC